MKSYALWDTRSTNIVQAHDNERDALALVLSGIELNGPDDTDTLFLNVEDEDRTVRLVVQGRELAERARREFAEHPVVR